MIAVIDYGIGNVRSVLNSFEYIGAKVFLTKDPAELAKADGLVLPGVGAFGEGMRRLDKLELREPLVMLAHSGKPLLGICLGFQMLMRSSTEQGLNNGLALIDEEVVKLPVNGPLPHIGWSRVRAIQNAEMHPMLLKGVNDEYFYFVHSYGVVDPAMTHGAGFTKYSGCELLAVIESGNVFGTQFHPEKSGEAGLEMLKNFMRICL